MKQFFRCKYTRQSVYFHFQEWCKDGSWQRVWQHILNKYKHLLDLSSIQLDGTHTPTKRGGEAVAYQGRKKAETSNMLILTDNQGFPLTCSDPIEGNHNDAFNLVPTVQKIITVLETSNICTDGLFLNADAGFDTEEFRGYCSEVEIMGNIDQK